MFWFSASASANPIAGGKMTDRTVHRTVLRTACQNTGSCVNTSNIIIEADKLFCGGQSVPLHEAQEHDVEHRIEGKHTVD